MLQYPTYTKKDILKKFLKKIKKDSKKVWEAINTIINNNKNTKSLCINNVITTYDKAITSHFNKFFTSMAYKLIKKIPQTNCTYHNYLKNPNEKSLFMHPVTH